MAGETAVTFPPSSTQLTHHPTEPPIFGDSQIKRSVWWPVVAAAETDKELPIPRTPGPAGLDPRSDCRSEHGMAIWQNAPVESPRRSYDAACAIRDIFHGQPPFTWPGGGG